MGQQPAGGYIWPGSDVSATSASAWLGIRHPQLHSRSLVSCHSPALLLSADTVWIGCPYFAIRHIHIILAILIFNFAICCIAEKQNRQWYGGISQLISLILGTVIDKQDNGSLVMNMLDSQLFSTISFYSCLTIGHWSLCPTAAHFLHKMDTFLSQQTKTKMAAI